MYSMSPPHPYNIVGAFECILLLLIFLSEAAFTSCAPSVLRFCAVDSSAQTNRAIAVSVSSVPALPALPVPAFFVLPLFVLALLFLLFLFLLFLLLFVLFLLFLFLLLLFLLFLFLLSLFLFFLSLLCPFLSHSLAFGFSSAHDIWCLLKQWIPEYMRYQEGQSNGENHQRLVLFFLSFPLASTLEIVGERVPGMRTHCPAVVDCELYCSTGPH